MGVSESWHVVLAVAKYNMYIYIYTTLGRQVALEKSYVCAAQKKKKNRGTVNILWSGNGRLRVMARGTFSSSVQHICVLYVGQRADLGESLLLCGSQQWALESHGTIYFQWLSTIYI